LMWFRPEESMRFRPVGSMPTRRLVDADRKGRCDADQGWSMPTKVGRCRPARSKLRRIPTRPEKPERQTVGTPEEVGISENTGTKNSRRCDSFGKHRNTEAPSGRRRNTEEPELPTRSFDSSGRYPGTSTSGEGESEADAKSETGTDVQDGKPEPRCGRRR
jgi:hypothetical protein